MGDAIAEHATDMDSIRVHRDLARRAEPLPRRHRSDAGSFVRAVVARGHERPVILRRRQNRRADSAISRTSATKTRSIVAGRGDRVPDTTKELPERAV